MASGEASRWQCDEGLWRVWLLPGTTFESGFNLLAFKRLPLSIEGFRSVDRTYCFLHSAQKFLIFAG
jgi:hypothetical protein